ncbi:hypothetical protein KR059_001593 [Drosophila kikkawai]|nr:hypothetical protein KR059_001593 [Drosophila kikkawai]
MAKSCHWCRVSRACVVQINVVLIVVGLIFMLDVVGHHYLRSHIFPGLRLYPVALRDWLFWVRGLTLLVYILNAILGIRMALNPSILKFALYVLIGLVDLLYTLTIAVTRFMYREKFEYFARHVALEFWAKDELGKIEEEFKCCGVLGVIDYQTDSSNRTWSSGSCCEKPECSGCIWNIKKYLGTIEMEVARDNFFVSIFLFVGLIFMLVHFKDAQFHDDPYEDDSEDDTEGSLDPPRWGAS